MKLFSYTALLLLAGTSAVNAASIPNVHDLAIREAEVSANVQLLDERDLHELEKRRGGGGSSGGGGGKGEHTVLEKR